MQGLLNIFVRFSGDALVATDYERLDHWAHRIAELHQRGIEEVYFILHQKQEGKCIELAEYLLKRMPAAELPAIQRFAEREQLKLW